eukprot:GFUD01024438.1.p1 GENE.GFUD01024438.1~~GFUD01024438.1.p1  ORF type:complete len:770 (+),score=149.75 GFUD01024438.1:193-2502(+)
MGNSNGKNRTHPVADHEPDYAYKDYGYDYEYDQRNDYDSGWHPDKTYGEAYFHEHNNDSPLTKRRSCTDVLCLILFLVFLGGWGAVAFLGIQGGDISKVIYPTDSQGNICGKGEMADRQALLMFDLTQCLNPAVLVTGCLTTHVCVNKCPDENYSPLGEAKLGTNQQQIKERMKPFCKPVSDEQFKQDVETLVQKEICPPWYLKSSEVLGRCFPVSMKAEDNDSNEEVVVKRVDTGGDHDITKGEIEGSLYRLGAFLNIRQFGERIFMDLKETYWMIGLALIGACILSFVWIVLMRFLASFMVWVSILTVFLGIGGLLGYSGYRLYFVWLSTDPETHKNIFQLNWTPEIVDDFLKQRDTWMAFTIILGIIFLVIVLLFLFLRQRIMIAIALIEQGSKAVGQMFSSLFFPIIPFLLQLVVVGWFLVVALYLASWGEQEYRVAFKNDRDCSQFEGCSQSVNGSDSVPYQSNDTCTPEEFKPCIDSCPEAMCQFVKYTKNKDYSWMQFVNVFGLYWGVFFFSAFGEIVLAGVFSQWYWTFNKKTDLPDCSLGTAMWNATVFHLGTIAFGSLLIAIIRMIRTMLEYVERKCKRFNNDLTKCLIWCCKCCLWCLEKFMRFINRNAYIMCAVKSTNFCKSAKEAFNLLMRNLVRVVVLDSVVDFLLFLGKLVIVLLTGVASYMTFSGQIPEIKDDIPSLNYFFTPIVFIVIGSYFIASAFFGVYNMAVDTLFLCFLEDLERNDGSVEKPYYMSKSLKKILGKMEKSVNESRHRSP